jgi:hypothetical protein
MYKSKVLDKNLQWEVSQALLTLNLNNWKGKLLNKKTCREIF